MTAQSPTVEQRALWRRLAAEVPAPTGAALTALLEALDQAERERDGEIAAATHHYNRRVIAESERDALALRVAKMEAVIEAAKNWRYAMCGNKAERAVRGLKDRGSELLAALRALAPPATPGAAPTNRNEE